MRYLHLMPLLTPRPAPNDGGYAVMDYRSVRPDLGTIEDLRALTRELRGRGISLCLDLVLNHVAREHEWARRARAGDPTYRDYFLVFPDREMPDAYERTLPEVFPDFAPGSFTWDDELDGWVWTTFNDYQWDVNWANPDVLCEYADIILALANDGVEVLRLDAIAFTWKRMGTNCQNQPEVHALTQALRTVARIACPATLFKAEAIVGPQDLLAYLGQGEHWGKVSDLAYHNGADGAHLVDAGQPRRPARLARAAGSCRATPSTTAWITYARCHDDIGWAIDDETAAAVGVSGYGHRRVPLRLLRRRLPRLVGPRPGLPGEPGDPATGASPARWPRWPGSRPATRWPPDRIRLVHALVLGFGGLPVIWMGDELGLLNDPDWDAGARARRRQPVGAPPADAVADAAGRRTASTPRCGR